MILSLLLLQTIEGNAAGSSYHAAPYCRCSAPKCHASMVPYVNNTQTGAPDRRGDPHALAKRNERSTEQTTRVPCFEKICPENGLLNVSTPPHVKLGHENLLSDYQLWLFITNDKHPTERSRQHEKLARQENTDPENSTTTMNLVNTPGCEFRPNQTST